MEGNSSIEKLKVEESSPNFSKGITKEILQKSRRAFKILLLGI